MQSSRGPHVTPWFIASFTQSMSTRWVREVKRNLPKENFARAELQRITGNFAGRAFHRDGTEAQRSRGGERTAKFYCLNRINLSDAAEGSLLTSRLNCTSEQDIQDTANGYQNQRGKHRGPAESSLFLEIQLRATLLWRARLVPPSITTPSGGPHACRPVIFCASHWLGCKPLSPLRRKPVSNSS